MKHEHATPGEMEALRHELSQTRAPLGGNVIGNFHEVAEEDELNFV